MSTNYCQTAKTEAIANGFSTKPEPAQLPAAATTIEEEKSRPPSDSGPAPGPPAGPSATVSALPLPDDSQHPPLSPYTFERQRLQQLTMPTVPNFDIPDSPSPPERNGEEAAALAATTKKFERFLELKKQGVHFNERLQNSTSLQNPALLFKLLDFAGVSQEEIYPSSLPDELAVPAKWPEECYAESLVKQNERKEKKRLQERDRLDFVPPKAKG